MLEEKHMKTLALAGLLAVLGAGAAAAATTHTVVKGDHLWGLAGRYYKNNFRWQAIFAANKDTIKDPHWIYPGQVLTIPDLPSPEIGELPAEPLPQEASAPVQQPDETAETAEAPEAAPQAPAQAASAPAPEPAPAKTDDLSAKMPAGMAGMYPSMVRVNEAKDWKEDGRITEFGGREILAAAGDRVVGALDQPASPGQEFEVYRKAAPEELDAQPDARHFQRVGVIKVEADLGKGQYRFLIVSSVDSVQAGDVLKRKAS